MSCPKTMFSTSFSGPARATEERIRNIFLPIKKRPPIVTIAILGLCTLLCGNLVSCQEVQDIPTSPSASASYSEPSDGSFVAYELMLHDLSFAPNDIPFLMDRLSESNYLAFYADHDLTLRITQSGIIEGSENAGKDWSEYSTSDIPTDEFSNWILRNDPVPGYSMTTLQDRLSLGAQVKMMSIDENKEFYFIISKEFAQIIPVQREKSHSIVLDGQRMMLTSPQSHPIQLSESLTKSFYDLLVDNHVLSADEADQDLADRLAWINGEDYKDIHIVIR